VPRPEDWPIMPAVKGGFKLKPFGFFNGNPCIDVSPPPCDILDHKVESTTEPETTSAPVLVAKL